MSKRVRRGRGTPPGRFRIIGGAWRGRRLEIANHHELRPTPDRVRETVFNWLQSQVEGAVCLDLYAGSGALGLEALSRGAARCVFVDRDRQVLAMIERHLERLACNRAELVHADAMAYLGGCRERFDLVFLDPPFADRPWPALLGAIAAGSLLEPGGRVYLENLAADGPPPLPAEWRLLRSKRAGRVGYHLASPATAEKP